MKEQETKPIEFVMGFLMNGSHVLLVRKKRPDWMLGKYNGIGGKMNPGESVLQAMQREAKEEANIDPIHWRLFLTFRVKSQAIVYCHAAELSPECGEIKSSTDEPIFWIDNRELGELPIMPDLAWMIPMARDASHSVAEMKLFSNRF